MAESALQIVWAYDHAHRQHPFIVLGLETLVAAGHAVSVVAADEAPKDAPYRAYDDFSFADRQAAYARRAKGGRWSVGRIFGAIMWRTMDLWTPYLCAFSRLRRMRADVVIASRPQAAIIAALAAKLSGARFVYYPFELYGEQLVGGDWPIKLLESFLLRFWVDALITQNAERANVYRKERGARTTPVIVRNFKRMTDPPAEKRLRAAHPALAQRRIVLYEGQLVGGRWLDRLVRSIEFCADDVVLVMMGPEKGKWVERHKELIASARDAGRVVVLPPVPHQDLPAYVAEADVGVIIYDDSVRNNRFCEPGKLSDYVAAGAPVVAPRFPTIAPLIEGGSLGACFESGEPRAIADAIMAVLAQPKTHWAPYLARARETLTWESQTPAFLAAVTGRSAA